MIVRERRITLDERQRRRIFQNVKGMTNEGFWMWMNQLHTNAYELAEKHMTEAMQCHPRISKRTIEEVKAKAVDIRENWDGLKTITVDDTVEYDNPLFRTR